MTWAQSLNAGQMANQLSNNMSNIHLNTNISPAEIQTKINQQFNVNPNMTNTNNPAMQNNFQYNQPSQPVQTQYTQQQQQYVQPQPQTQYAPPLNNYTQQQYTYPQVDTYTPQATMYQPQTQYQQPVQYQTYQAYPQYVQQPVNQYTYPAMQQYSYPQMQYQQPVYTQPAYTQPVYVQPPQATPQTYDVQPAYTPSINTEANTPSTTNQDTGSNLDINTDDLNFANTNIDKTSELKKYYYNAKLSQGVLAKTADWTKGIFNLKGTAKQADLAIQKYENGQISYEEALKEVSNFADKQNSNSETIANFISGTAGALAAVSASAKGKGTGASIGIAALTGALSKGLSKMVERGTNGITGDFLSTKDILKDLTTGAANGAIAGGVSNLNLNGKEITAATGSITGAVSGAGIGYTNYMADVITDENKKFSINDALKQTAGYAIGGAVIGGAAGLAHSVKAKSSNNVEGQNNIQPNDPQTIEPRTQNEQPLEQPTQQTQQAQQTQQQQNTHTPPKPTGYKGVEPKSEADFITMINAKPGEHVSIDGKTVTFTESEQLHAIKNGAQYISDPEGKALFESFLDNPNETTLKKFYKTMAKKYHPDLHPGDPTITETAKFYNGLNTLLSGLLKNGKL